MFLMRSVVTRASHPRRFRSSASFSRRTSPFLTSSAVNIISSHYPLLVASLLVSCEAGKFIMETGSYKCDDCDRGKYSSMNSFECFECAPGRYMNSTGQESCHECMIGSYAVDYGAFICSTCTPGTYSETMGTVFCIECAGEKLRGAKRRAWNLLIPFVIKVESAFSMNSELNE